MKCLLATSGVASYRERLYYILMFFGISVFIYSPRYIRYTDISFVAVEATIDKSSPQGKLLFKSERFIFETGSACCYFKTQQALLSRQVHSCFRPVKQRDTDSSFECRFDALNVDILRRLRS